MMRPQSNLIQFVILYCDWIRRRDCVNPQDATSRSQRDLLCLFVWFQPQWEGRECQGRS